MDIAMAPYRLIPQQDRKAAKKPTRQHRSSCRHARCAIEGTSPFIAFFEEITMTIVTTCGARSNLFDWIAGVLVIIGALNWGLVGLFQFDLVAAILGAGSMMTRIIYVLVGLAGIYCLIRAFIMPKVTVSDSADIRDPK
ncbi:Hypothetical membrane associated protein [Mycetohabitans rhizoxinica HKI 454]|nr:Hypothetical membrane associated protein [Mycetohabitans rhizoxinica HKI 454]